MAGRLFEDIQKKARDHARVSNFYSAFRYYNLLRLVDPDNKQIELEFIQVTLSCYFLIKEEDEVSKLFQEKANREYSVPDRVKEMPLSAGEQLIQTHFGVNLRAPLKSNTDKEMLSIRALLVLTAE